MSVRKSNEPESNENLKEEVKQLFRNTFFKEWEEFRTFIILMWNQKCSPGVSNDEGFRNLFEKVKYSFHTRSKTFTSMGSTIPSVEVKIIKSGEKSTTSSIIFVEFEKLELIVTLISEIFDNVDTKVLGSIIKTHFKMYRTEFIHLLTIKILILMGILKEDLMEKVKKEIDGENFEILIPIPEENRKNLDFLKLKIQNPVELKGYLNLFLIRWKKYYPDQCKTHVNNIAYSKKISKMEAMKLLEKEITEEFKSLVDTYQNFPNPFVIYTCWEIPYVNEFFEDTEDNIEEYKFVKGKRDVPEFWSWSKESRFPPEIIGDNETYFITGLIFKKDVNWSLTLLKNCELAYGLDEKEILLFMETEIKIKKIEGKNFLREL